MVWYADFETIVKTDAPLASRTWFGLGGPAKYFIAPRTAGELAAVVCRLRDNNIPMYVLGAGANLLIRDQGVDGAVISLHEPEFRDVDISERHVRAGAGADVPRLVLQCAKAGLGGLECLAGIPGTVGGEIRMNAGGVFGNIGSRVLAARAMDTHGRIYTIARDDLVFDYRRSNINAKFIIQATFELVPDDPQRLVSRVKEIWMYKRNTQPLAESSAGCIFRNANGFSAGALIDQAGLKGVSVGRAQVSTRHANFIVARPGATAADVLALIDLIRRRVREQTNVLLETEVIIW